MDDSSVPRLLCVTNDGKIVEWTQNFQVMRVCTVQDTATKIRSVYVNCALGRRDDKYNGQHNLVVRVALLERPSIVTLLQRCSYKTGVPMKL